MHFPTIYPVTCHTQYVGKGSTFVAIQGFNEDGARYIPQAIAQGATTIVVQENAVIPEATASIIADSGVQVIKVANTRLALAHLSAQAAGYPAHSLRIMGITGTKGKTTSAFLLEHIIRSAGYRTALLGTVKNSIMDHNLGTGLTTQQPDYLHQFLKLCVENSIDYVIMEVAAQGLSMHRLDGIKFDGIVFTNFSQEHGEFYASQQEYFEAKKSIFAHLKGEGFAMINADDAWCQKIIAEYPAYSTFGKDSQADFSFNILETLNNGISVEIIHQKQVYQLQCPSLIGNFNAYNCVGVYAAALQLGIASAVVTEAFSTFTKVPGRLERHLLSNGACCIIDYAHNPSSFESVLSTLRQLTDHLIVVFGAGGNRDAAKRPIMGAIAARHADVVIITSDNPRSEDPAVISDEIFVGIPDFLHNKVVRILDRKEAIEYACAQSHNTTIIALLGKGPDEYQQIGAIKYPFSEATIISAFK